MDNNFSMTAIGWYDFLRGLPDCTPFAGRSVWHQISILSSRTKNQGQDNAITVPSCPHLISCISLSEIKNDSDTLLFTERPFTKPHCVLPLLRSFVLFMNCNHQYKPRSLRAPALSRRKMESVFLPSSCRASFGSPLTLLPAGFSLSYRASSR